MLVQPYRTVCLPPKWASTGHAQTLWAHFIPSPLVDWESSEKHQIPLSDGDRIIARHTQGESTLVCLFHGLGGDAQVDYINRAARVCWALGWGTLAVNHRGCGEGEGLAANPYHSGSAEDMSSVVAYARSQLRGYSKVLVVGHSLSGNILALLLSQTGVEKPDGGIAINAPIDLAEAAKKISQGWNRIYDIRFVLRCRKAIDQRWKSGLIEKKYSISPWATLMEFDSFYTAPAGGFRDRDDYYSQCSSAPRLHKVDRPLVMITASDDPFIGVEAYRNTTPSSSVHFHIEPFGGHMGYLSKHLGKRRLIRWLDGAVAHYLQELSALS